MYLFPLKSDNVLNHHHFMLKNQHYRFKIILELKFGTKRKKKLRPISRTSGIESNHSGYRSWAYTYFQLSMECHVKLRIQAH